MRDHTIDEALVELARTMKALKALRDERKAQAVPPAGPSARILPYGWRPRSVLAAAARRASLDLTRKLADLRAGR
jgi:hypothetical protein